MPERFFVPNNIVVILVLVLFMLTDFVATATQSRRQPAVHDQDDRGPIRRRSIIRTNKFPGFPDKIGLHSENFALNKPSYEQPKQLKIMNTTKIGVLLVLCLQNSVFTVLRRYSQGILQETYSSHEVLMAAEVVKMAFSAWMIGRDLPQKAPGVGLVAHLGALVRRSRKMLGLALLYGAMNILSFVALRNIGAGTFTICAQMKILTTAAFSSLLLGRRYSAAKWRALLQLILGVLLFSAPAFEGGGGGGGGHGEGDGEAPAGSYSQAFLGTAAVLIEVTLSGFASIYFEKVLKKDTEGLSIWERNFQLALWSVPVYVGFIGANGGGAAGYGGGWSPVAVALAGLGAAGGLLVALSIKHGDSILKTLATTGAITVSAALDHLLLGGPLTNVMVLAAAVVVLAICNYTFDATPATAAEGNGGGAAAAGGGGPGSTANKARASEPPSQSGRGEDGGGGEGAPMLPRQNSELVARPARGGKDSKV